MRKILAVCQGLAIVVVLVVLTGCSSSQQGHRKTVPLAVSTPKNLTVIRLPQSLKTIIQKTNSAPYIVAKAPGNKLKPVIEIDSHRQAAAHMDVGGLASLQIGHSFWLPGGGPIPPVGGVMIYGCYTKEQRTSAPEPTLESALLSGSARSHYAVTYRKRFTVVTWRLLQGLATIVADTQHRIITIILHLSQSIIQYDVAYPSKLSLPNPPATNLTCPT